jgi:predicted NAD/FAD-binding protein
LHTAFALLLAQGPRLDAKSWAAIRLMRGLQANNFRIAPDRTVSAWLESQKTPSRQRRLLWEPLCIAALNTPAERASAQVLANVLRDSLGGAREASDMLLPQVDLSALFPGRRRSSSPARRQVQPSAIASPACAARPMPGGSMPTGPYAQVVLAVAPYHLAALLPELAPTVAHFDWEPIVTSYFRYPAGMRLPQPMLGVDAGLAQWLFDRGRLCGQHGLIAAVISARGRHLELPTAELEQRIHAEIARIVPGLPPPELGADHHRKARHLRLRAEPPAPAHAHRPARPLAGR